MLTGTLGPGFRIALLNADGTAVTHLDPGAYTVHVVDQAEDHNYHLLGTGVDQKTDVVGVGDVDWQVTFVAGTYTYVCDAHFAFQQGKFTVGTVAVPVQALSGSVGPGAKISLARSAKAGKATITVRDRSAKDNLHLRGPGVNRKTGVAFKGSVKWTVTLTAGAYTYRSDAHPALHGTLRVG